MKKVYAILLAGILCFGCLLIPALAAPADELVPVVVKVPESWTEPHLWAWSDDGANAFASWPGEEFEAMDGGWWYCYVPSFVQNIIVNAADASVQTDGVKVDAGKPVWLTISEDKTAAVSYDAQSGEVPAYVEKFVVHAYVPLDWETVGLWAWSAPDGRNAFAAWPGLELKEGDNGWFTGKAPTWINSLIINGNNGSVQTADISVEARELWITVYQDKSYELAYEDPDKAVADITFWAKVPEGWSEPHAWAWSAPDGTNAFTSWPGDGFTQDGDWWYITVPGWINSVIVNANEGSVQTADLSVEKGKDVWVVVNAPDDAAVFYDRASADAAQPAAPAASQPPASQAPASQAPASQAPASQAPASQPSASPAPAPAQEGGGNTGAIVGGVAAVLAVAGVAGGVVYSKKKKK